MYLIQYTSINFIDAEDIYALTVSANCVKFSIRGDDKSVFEVDKNLEVQFLNHLQEVNNNERSVVDHHASLRG
jgi:hypothetical protein